MFLEALIRKLMEHTNIKQSDLEIENPYTEGSDEWWNFEIAAGEADIKNNRAIELNSSEDIDNYFKSV
jgi:hypothetical protein